MSSIGHRWPHRASRCPPRPALAATAVTHGRPPHSYRGPPLCLRSAWLSLDSAAPPPVLRLELHFCATTARLVLMTRRRCLRKAGGPLCASSVGRLWALTRTCAHARRRGAGTEHCRGASRGMGAVPLTTGHDNAAKRCSQTPRQTLQFSRGAVFELPLLVAPLAQSNIMEPGSTSGQYGGLQDSLPLSRFAWLLQNSSSTSPSP